MFDRQAAINAHIIHNEDHVRNFSRLKGMYGRVAHSQNIHIITYCQGQRVLDVGAGYGNLTRQLLDAGKDAIGIEIDDEKIKRAYEWFGVQLQFTDFYNYENGKERIDTVVFREVLNHLNLDRALSKAFLIAKHRCLVFQGTEIPILRLAKRIYHHAEHDQKNPEEIILGLERAGFIVRKVIFRDVFAFPLSGGWWGRCWIPSWKFCESVVLGIDLLITRLINMLRLGRYFCFRVLIVAEKPEANDGNSEKQP